MVIYGYIWVCMVVYMYICGYIWICISMDRYIGICEFIWVCRGIFMSMYGFYGYIGMYSAKSYCSELYYT